MLSLLPLDNEFVLWLSLLVIAACVVYELMQFHDKRKELESIDYRTLIPLKQPRNVSFLFPPVHESCPVRTHVCLDLLALAKYIPLDAKMNTPQRLERHVSQSVNSAPRSPKKVAATERKKHEQVERYTNDIYSKIMDPLPPDCQPQSNNVNALLEKHPDLTRVDIVRFLVARKGNQQLADEMILKFKAWRSRHFPLRRSNVETALRTRCVFPFGTARDGTPVIYFRGGLYDNTKASAEAYVLAGAHCIDYIFQQYPLEVNITIVVHTGTTKEGPNAAADTNFLKLFISVSARIPVKRYGVSFIP